MSAAAAKEIKLCCCGQKTLICCYQGPLGAAAGRACAAGWLWGPCTAAAAANTCVGLVLLRCTAGKVWGPTKWGQQQEPLRWTYTSALPSGSSSSKTASPSTSKSPLQGESTASATKMSPPNTLAWTA
ncbi:hypothetical protein ETH_00006460, partial [Eimeria tenella]